MRREKEHRVEELSKRLGGRFKLTALIQKRVRNYFVAGRAFMPKVRNLDELFDLVMDQIDHGEIRLYLPEEQPGPFKDISDLQESTAGAEASEQEEGEEELTEEELWGEDEEDEDEEEQETEEESPKTEEEEQETEDEE